MDLLTYYKIIKDKLEKRDFINNQANIEINSHIEAINYLLWEFMKDRNDTRIERVFDNVCIPNNVNVGELDIDFSKYNVEDFLKEIMKIKN